MPNNLVYEHERLDELHRNGYFIIQDPKRFCFGMDAVLLSGFAKAKKGERVLDLGTGTGIIPILMEAKTEAEDFKALEIQEESADMARRSVRYNHLEDKIEIVTGDIKEASAIFGGSSFDVITTNPPYMIGTHGQNSPSEAKAIARHEVLCTLDDILRETAKMLVSGGRFYMVHRPFRLAALCICLGIMDKCYLFCRNTILDKSFLQIIINSEVLIRSRCADIRKNKLAAYMTVGISFLIFFPHIFCYLIELSVRIIWCILINQSCICSKKSCLMGNL